MCNQFLVIPLVMSGEVMLGDRQRMIQERQDFDLQLHIEVSQWHGGD
jgi:hypothetical protein